MIVRFDDISINSNMVKVLSMTDYCLKQDFDVMWGVSVLCSNLAGTDRPQKVYPRNWNTSSDHRVFYGVDLLGMPSIPNEIIKASHGLVHVDHRLLGFDAQEMSIIVSCSLTGAGYFIPPFNKWNKDTESICAEHDIKLVKFEDGWLSMEHNKYNPNQDKWYFHPASMTLSQFTDWWQM